MREHIQDNSVDLIFTDPPYGIEGDKLDTHYNRNESHVVPGYVEVALETYDQFSTDWITECARVLRPGGSMYIAQNSKRSITSLPNIVLVLALHSNL
jgi:site-specific DNA-methyltransferase (adenine-specific)